MLASHDRVRLQTRRTRTDEICDHKMLPTSKSAKRMRCESTHLVAKLAELGDVAAVRGELTLVLGILEHLRDVRARVASLKSAHPRTSAMVPGPHLTELTVSLQPLATSEGISRHFVVQLPEVRGVGGDAPVLAAPERVLVEPDFAGGNRNEHRARLQEVSTATPAVVPNLVVEVGADMVHVAAKRLRLAGGVVTTRRGTHHGAHPWYSASEKMSQVVPGPQRTDVTLSLHPIARR